MLNPKAKRFGFGFYCGMSESGDGMERDELPLHVPGVAKVDARLGGTLVGSVLQRDDVGASAELLIAEVAHVLVRLLGSDRWLVEVGGLGR